MAVAESQDAETNVRILRCDTWDDFIMEQRKILAGSDHIYRGQRKTDWRLSSELERRLSNIRGPDVTRSHGFAREDYERMPIENFKDLARGLPDTDTDNLQHVDWMALARHHGMTSPWLDWTRSPYVAAFFAFLSSIEEANPRGLNGLFYRPGFLATSRDRVAIWALELDPELEVKGEFEIIWSRSQLNYWQKAQRGVFTSLKHDSCLDIESYLKSRSLGGLLKRYEVPGQEATRALCDMELMNITYANLFPDFRGAAIQANIGKLFRLAGAVY